MYVHPDRWRAVLGDMQATGHFQELPSVAVLEAATAIEPAKIERTSLPVKLYHVEGSRGARYMVALTMSSLNRDADIVRFECSCRAGQTGQTCKHAMRVLAEANRSGHHFHNPNR